MTVSRNISVELFIATGCAYCPVVLSALSDLLKNGQLASLNITNIAVSPEKAEALNIRSVPWFSLSSQYSHMIFSGNYSPNEISHWVTAAQSDNGMQEYIEKFLAEGHLPLGLQAIQLQPETFSSVITMLEDEDTSMHVRIGLDALLENFTSSDILKQYTPSFKSMATKENIRLQIDALHYLALTGDPENRSFIQKMTNDKNEQIRAAAEEALETLQDLLS